MPDGEGSVAVGCAVRMASRVAAFTAGVPGGGTACGWRVVVAVIGIVDEGEGKGDNGTRVGVRRGEANGKEGMGALAFWVRHTKNTADTHTARPNTIKKRVRRLTYPLHPFRQICLSWPLAQYQAQTSAIIPPSGRKSRWFSGTCVGDTSESRACSGSLRRTPNKLASPTP